MIGLSDLISQSSLQGKTLVGISGDELLTIARDEIFFPNIWSSTLKNKTSCALEFRRNILYNIMSKLKEITQKKILIVAPGNRPFIYSNVFNLSKILNTKFLLKYVTKDNINPKLAFDSIRLIDEVSSFIGETKLIVIMHLPIRLYSSMPEDTLSQIIYLLKRLSPSEYLRFLSHKKCVMCNYSMDDTPFDYFKDSHNLTRYFNLPICSNHILDFYKIAMDYRNDKFDIDYFIKNIEDYTKLKFHTCVSCGRKMKRVISSPICINCLKCPSDYFMSVALGLIDPNKPSDNLLKLLKCPDCGVSLEREGLCKACEKNYNWRRVELSLNDGSLIWSRFLSDSSIRIPYRITRSE